MSMVACVVCGGTIDCSGWDFYVCCKCGKATHLSCDNDRVKGAYFCPECRKKDNRIRPLQGLKVDSPPLPTIKEILEEIKDMQRDAPLPQRLPKFGDMWGAKICPLNFRDKQDNNESEES